MSSTLSQRISSRSKQEEPNENDAEKSKPDPFLSLPPRSPLITIPDPSQNPRDGQSKPIGSTPKSGQTTPVRSAARICFGNGGNSSQHVGLKERGFLSKISKWSQEQFSAPAEVPYFDLEENPHFWNDHNVQVLIRIRPINAVESALQGPRRCLMQESSQSLTWIGSPQARFTFDHVACEATSQEKLFRVAGLPMVENCMSGYNSCMFAYGQTGSGKTYTMMGEIHENNGLNDDRGMTPRIFEYLFMRIKEEEERRLEQQLKYSCKCSFLEIYNEQIIDLLEPSSSNLQLREDIRMGVYVENLKEYEVYSVRDVIRLLVQGAANRKIAATNLNSESSRSHSVFTCVIESHWENDSMKHIRYGRLNLVDLAGSERQKTSGAEGDRLREAANINKSLSTLGLVIMMLVDIANGKIRHVPYRDSRLTFLLQDSLGGNSKTSIVATISPSISSSSETLCTLKFAQRAKLIQNNAKVNEDTSGDVMALQREIERLKDQLSLLTMNQKFPDSPGYLISNVKKAHLDDIYDEHVPSFRTAVSEHARDSTILNGKDVAFMELERCQIELASCLEDNTMLSRVVSDLYYQLQHQHYGQNKIRKVRETSKDNHLLQKPDEVTLEELSSTKRDLGVISSKHDNNIWHQNNELHTPDVSLLRDIQKKLKDSEMLVATMELEQVRLSGEVETLKQENNIYSELIKNNIHEMTLAKLCSQCSGATESICSLPTLRTMQKSNEVSNNLNWELQDFETSQLRCKSEMEDFRWQDEATIPCLDQFPALEQGVLPKNKSQLSVMEENMILKSKNEELTKRAEYLIKQNRMLSKLVADKDSEMKSLSDEWERAMIDLTGFLVDGCRSLEDASGYVQSIVNSLPHRNLYTSEHIERAIMAIMEKESLLVDLQKLLKNAQELGLNAQLELKSLRGTTLAIAEVQQEYDEDYSAISQFKQMLDEKNSEMHELKKLLEYKEGCIAKAEKNSEAAYAVIKKLYDLNVTEPLDADAIKCMIANTKKFTNDIPYLKKPLHLSDVRDNNEFQHNMHAYLSENLQEKSKLVSRLDVKFEEVRKTMEEAEIVIDALLKANEDAKQEQSMWKLASEELQSEKNMLIDKFKRLEDTNLSEIENYEIQLEKIHSLVQKISSIVLQFGGTFQQVKSIMQDILLSDIIGMHAFGLELLEVIHSSSLALEDLISETMEKGFTSFVMYQCLIGSFKQHDIHLILGFHPVLIKDVGFSRMVSDIGNITVDTYGNLIAKAAHVMDVNGKTKEIVATPTHSQRDLETRTEESDHNLAKQKELEDLLAKAEAALSHSKLEMEQTRESLVILEQENQELKLLFEDAYDLKARMEGLPECKSKVTEGLHTQILSRKSSEERRILSFAADIKNELRRVCHERDSYQSEIAYLFDKLEMTSALADENEAIAVEARQVAEASKNYAKEKEEEAKVLEHSVEVLEGTIDVLEKKLGDMKEELKDYQLIRERLELEVQALKQRIHMVENAAENLIMEYSNGVTKDDCIPRQLDKIPELGEVRKHVKDLEVENRCMSEEIKQYQDHISELILHSEAQSSLYQSKFKELEAIVSVSKPEHTLVSNPTGLLSKNTEKVPARTRGPGSPFRCIANLVQQVNLEQDQELCNAKLRIEEVEVVAANRQKEICMLTARLASVDCMTHDVIRDLMGVKQDMTNYAKIVEQEQQLQKSLANVRQPTIEVDQREKQLVDMKQQIINLSEERQHWLEEMNQRKADMLAVSVTVERLKQRDQLLSAQNEMLKLDKDNLHCKIAELEEQVKLLAGMQRLSHQIQRPKEGGVACVREEPIRRLPRSDKSHSGGRQEHGRLRRLPTTSHLQ